MSSTHILSAVAVACLCGAVQPNDRPDPAGFTPLFNGKDLTGWKPLDSKPGNWTVEDGMIVCNGTGGGWLGTEREYADFILKLEYRIKPGGNSGVYLRAPDKGHISRDGMEIQILDDNAPPYAKIDFYQYTGSLYHVVAPTRRAARPPGQWNDFEIRARGREITVILNRIKVVDADLDHCLKDEQVAKEHPGLRRTTGRIGLQSHTDRVEFRNLRINDLTRQGP